MQEYRKYFDKNGLVSHSGKPSGNGLLYTAQYAYVLKMKGWDTPLAIESLKTVYRSCEISMGHFARTPDQGFGPQAPDDYFGVALFSKLFDPTLSLRVLVAGRVNRWMLNERDPGVWRLKSWLGRMPHLVLMFESASGEKGSLLNIIWAHITLLRVAFFSKRKSQDSWIKAWMLKEVCDLPISSEIFEMRLRKVYPHGIGEVLAAYGWSHHPNSKYLWDVV